jgi:pyrimidine operon attenuation protein/uracil phosphoribosyltransferase
MEAEKTLVLDSSHVKKKIRRMAFEIYENNVKEKSMVVAGIEGQGYVLAKMLAKELESVSPLQTTLVKVSLNKEAPQQNNIHLDCEDKEVRKKSIVLVDDVLNTGRTLAYALKPFLDLEIKKIEVAVLVNRSHTSFPIYPNYIGYELSTTLKDHVEVVLGKESAVYLK